MDDIITTEKMLRLERLDVWNGLLVNSGLDIRQYPWWTDEEKALERELWEQADAHYENKKATEL